MLGSCVIILFLSTIYCAPINDEEILAFRNIENYLQEEKEFLREENKQDDIKLEKFLYYLKLITYIGSLIAGSLVTLVGTIINSIIKIKKNLKNLKADVDMVASNKILNEEISSLGGEIDLHESILESKKKSLIPVFLKRVLQKQNLRSQPITITSKIEEKSKIDSISQEATHNKLIDLDTNISTEGENNLNFQQPAIANLNQPPPTTFSTINNKDNNFHMILRPK
jgi:hypothetical protein